MPKKRIFLILILINFLLNFSINAQDKEGSLSAINSLEEIQLGGVKQWILIRGENVDNPILLFLHGGPGFPEMPFTHLDSNILEKHFTVVNWDQRGAGKSFNTNIPKETMTIKQFLSDTYELIEVLRNRFNKEKIFLAGHSWGSILGLKTAIKHPELLHAYIGIGQVIDMLDGELASYRYTVEKAKKAANDKDLKQLDKIGLPSDWEGTQSLNIQRQLLAKYGGSFQKISYMQLYEIWNSSPHYSQEDKANILRGMTFSQNLMWDQVMHVNFYEEPSELQIPVYFLTGRFDYQTPFEILVKYFKLLKAPHKEIIWFENSGHMPNIEEPEIFQNKIINVVLKNTRKQRGK